MRGCEAHRVDYVLGLAKNSRLKALITDAMHQAKAAYEASGEAARVFKGFRYQTLDSGSCERRVVAKAEYLSKGENPRFKEPQLALFADRTSAHEMHANQLRLYFSSFAYVLIQTLRRLGLKDTELTKTQCDTIRLKRLKVGTQIRISVRKIGLSFTERYPYAELFRRVFANIEKIPIRC